MVNDWECVCTVDVGEGERLVAISWIDTGIKVCFIPFAALYVVLSLLLFLILAPRGFSPGTLTFRSPHKLNQHFPILN